MKKNRLIAMAALVATPLPFCAVAAVTPISSSLYLYADANAGIGPVINDNGVAQAGTLNPLSTSVHAMAINGNRFASSFFEGTASWTSAAAGQVIFHSVFSTSDLSPFVDARVGAGYNPDFVYTFVSDLPGTFSMLSTSVTSGPYSYSAIFSASGLIGQNYVESISMQGPSTNTLSFPIQAGTAYTLWIAEGSNLNQYLPAFTSDARGTFTFQITPVPEPSGLAFSVLGALVLIARRNRTR